MSRYSSTPVIVKKFRKQAKQARVFPNKYFLNAECLIISCNKCEVKILTLEQVVDLFTCAVPGSSNHMSTQNLKNIYK
jgi:hypothetical protein